VLMSLARQVCASLELRNDTERSQVKLSPAEALGQGQGGILVGDSSVCRLRACPINVLDRRPRWEIPSSEHRCNAKLQHGELRPCGSEPLSHTHLRDL